MKPLAFLPGAPGSGETLGLGSGRLAEAHPAPSLDRGPGSSRASRDLVVAEVGFEQLHDLIGDPGAEPIHRAYVVRREDAHRPRCSACLMSVQAVARGYDGDPSGQCGQWLTSRPPKPEIQVRILAAPLTSSPAGVLELADRPGLGPGARKSVWVQIPPPASFLRATRRRRPGGHPAQPIYSSPWKRERHVPAMSCGDRIGRSQRASQRVRWSSSCCSYPPPWPS